MGPRQYRLAWAAGFIDGEGCITIYPYKDRGYRLFALQLRANQTDIRPLNLLKELFGGTVSPIKSTPNRKQAWVWRVTGPRAEIALKEILPFLVVKIEQAKVALEYRSLVGPAGKPTTIPIEQMEGFVNKLKELKVNDG